MCLHGWYFEQWMSEQNAMLVNNGNGRDARATETNLNSPAGMKIGNFMAELAKMISTPIQESLKTGTEATPSSRKEKR